MTATPKWLLKALDERDGHRSAEDGVESDTLVPQHRQCSLPDCEVRAYGLGYCRNHYARFKRHGTTDLLHVPMSTYTIQERLEMGARAEGECIIWIHPRDKDGYGTISVGNRKERAHRISYLEHKGEIPPGLIVRHTCDNPPCINPDHLIVGTYQDNARDRSERTRTFAGEDNPAAVLDASKVREIRAELAAGGTVAAIAARFRVGTSTISRIKNGKSWLAA